MQHPGDRNHRHAGRIVFLLLLGTVLAGCDKSVEPTLTPIEQVRVALEQGSDESILFSPALLFNQDTTVPFTRTASRISRGLANPRFWENDFDFPRPRTTFEGDVVDTIDGTLTLRIGQTTRQVPFTRLAFGGLCEVVELGQEDWQIWRMRHRFARRPNSNLEPNITSMTVGDSVRTYSVATPTKFRIFRDSVLTLPVGAASPVTVVLTTDSPDDSFFVTYPVAGGYQTDVMTHVDSVTHRATVTVQSGRRFELLAVQGFKAEAFRDALYLEAAATYIQSAILAFR